MVIPFLGTTMVSEGSRKICGLVDIPLLEFSLVFEGPWKTLGSLVGSVVAVLIKSVLSSWSGLGGARIVSGS